jgi:hypothetical protein
MDSQVLAFLKGFIDFNTPTHIMIGRAVIVTLGFLLVTSLLKVNLGKFINSVIAGGAAFLTMYFVIDKTYFLFTLGGLIVLLLVIAFIRFNSLRHKKLKMKLEEAQAQQQGR